MERTYLRGVGVFPFASEQELIDYVERRPGILVAVNAEKDHSCRRRAARTDKPQHRLLRRCRRGQGLAEKGTWRREQNRRMRIVVEDYRTHVQGANVLSGRRQAGRSSTRRSRSCAASSTEYASSAIATDISPTTSSARRCWTISHERVPTLCSSLWARPGRSVLWSACSSVIRRYIRVWAAASTYTPDTSSVLRSGG